MDDPKSLEFAVQVSLLAYPSLFQIRQQVLNHYYCVLGNGYDWWDGRLRRSCDDEKHEGVEKMLLEGVSEDEIRAWVKAKDDDRWERSWAETQAKLKEMGLEFNPPPLSMHPLTIYPVCNLCAIMKLPDHIRPDWLAGAEEAAVLMETRNSYDEAGTLRNRSYLPEIRQRIAELKATLPETGAGGGRALAV
jgi:hypothetical protein